MTLEELAQKSGEFIAEEIIKPLAPKLLNETREERIKLEYAPVIGDYGWLVGVQKDATGRLVMKCPATVKLVEGGRVLLEHENGKTLGWTNLRIEKDEDGYSDFFYNLSGYWRCAMVDFATIDEIDVTFPGAKYGAGVETSASIDPEETYARQAEMRVRALRRSHEQVFETRYECQAVRFDEVTRNRTMFKRETERKNSKRKFEPFIIGCDMAQGESVAASRVIQKRIEVVEV